MNLLFKSKLFFLTCLLFLAGCSKDYLSYFEFGDLGPPPAIVLTTATVEDLHPFKSLMIEKVSHSGFPRQESLGHWFYEHHLKRVEEGNPYHLYTVKTACGELIGYVHLGVMPTMGYCLPAHCPIVDKWISLGVIEKVCEDNCLHRIDNRGIAFILPILKDDLTRGEEESTINASYYMLKSLRAEGKLLPNENTLPYQVIGLFKPSNDLINSFEGAGFTVDENDGFYKFYNKDRVMVTKPLDCDMTSNKPREIVTEPLEEPETSTPDSSLQEDIDFGVVWDNLIDGLLGEGSPAS